MNSMSELSPPEFVDSNILVYAHDASAGEKHIRARQLIEDLWQSRTGCLSIQVLQEFYVTITKKVSRPLSSDETARIIADLAVWEVHCPRVDNVLDAIGIRETHKISFWDAMIVASATHLGCQVLWSEDLNPGQFFSQLEVQNPFRGMS
jgi:predicted nucleic acid-binding protein